MNEGQETVAYEVSSTPRWIPIVLGILAVLIGYVLYAGHKARTDLEAEVAKTNQRADLLQKQLEQSDERLAGLQGQLEVTSQKLGLTQEELTKARSLAQNIRKEQKASDEQLLTQIGRVKQESEAKIGALSGEVSGAKSDIDATRKDLEATKGRLERTVGDLGVQSGMIARNKEEVEELKRRGERNIFEFDIRKVKNPQRVGPVQITLKKVDTKKFRYTMDLIADDKRIEKKDKTVNEPVQFYVRGARVPYEIVVFEVQKDRAIGYLTTPK
jgi:predicted  nucleic acid-binding Zn-ribbon protein